MVVCCFAFPVSFLFLLSLVICSETGEMGQQVWKIGALSAAAFLLLETIVIAIYICKRHNKSRYLFRHTSRFKVQDAFLGILFPQYLPITDNSAYSQANLNPNLTGRKFASYSVFACQGLFISFFINKNLNSVCIYLHICFIQGLLESFECLEYQQSCDH